MTMHSKAIYLVFFVFMLTSLLSYGAEDKLRLGNITFGSKFKGIPRVVSKDLNPQTDPPETLIDDLPLFGSFVIQLSEDKSGLLPQNVNTGVALLFTPKTKRIWGIIFETSKTCAPMEYSDELFGRITRRFGNGSGSSYGSGSSSQEEESSHPFGSGLLGESLQEFLDELEEYNKDKVKNSGILNTRRGKLLVLIFTAQPEKMAAKTNKKVKKQKLKIAFIDIPTFSTACEELTRMKGHSTSGE